MGDARHLIGEIGADSHSIELASHREREAAALDVAARCDVQPVADHLHVGVVVGEQAAHEGEVALVQLDLDVDAVGEAADRRRQAGLQRQVLEDVAKRPCCMGAGEAPHALAHQRILGVDAKLRLAVLLEHELDRADLAAEDLHRIALVAGEHADGRAQRQQVGVRMLEGEVDAAALVDRDIEEAQLQRRQAALGLAHFHRQQELLHDVGAPARDLDQGPGDCRSSWGRARSRAWV